jgi:hypothetical protein
MAVYQKSLLYIVKNSVFQEPVLICLQEIQTKTMNRTNEHLGETCTLAQLMAAECMYPILEFPGGFFGKCQGNDVCRADAVSGLSFEKIDDMLRKHACLARAGTGDHLKVSV